MERTIVTGVDGSANSRAAAEWAAREALQRGLPLCVVHAAPDRGRQWPCPPEAVAEHVMTELVDRHPALVARSLRLAGAPAPALRAAGAQAELLVLGSRGEGTHTEGGVGSTAAALAGGSAGPVVLVPGTCPSPGLSARSDRVAVGVDARVPAGGALDLAFSRARRSGARVHAVHAWRLPAERVRLPWPVPEDTRATWEDYEVQLLADALRPWREKFTGVEVLEDVVLLPAPDALAHASANAGLVVVGSRSGGTGLALLRQARCPVAVVPS